MKTLQRLSISELGLTAGSIIDLTDEPEQEADRDSGWFPNQVFQIGEYEITEWRSDRNHLELECQFFLKEGTDWQTPQILLLNMYKAIMGN